MITLSLDLGTIRNSNCIRENVVRVDTEEIAGHPLPPFHDSTQRKDTTTASRMVDGDFGNPSRPSSVERQPSPTPLVQPAHFYPPSSGASSCPSSTSHSSITPEDDPFATRGIPVFKPTMEEFEDFEEYMTRIERWGMHSGIVKVIPPKEWTKSLPSVHPQLGTVRIRNPIEQLMLGISGVFRQQNIEKRKEMSMREWAEMCMKDEYRAPAVHEVGLKSAGENNPYERKTRRRRRKRDEEIEAEDMVKEELEEEDVPLAERRAAARAVLVLVGRGRCVLLFGGALEEIEHEVRVHRRQPRVLLRDDGVGDVELEALEAAQIIRR